MAYTLLLFGFEAGGAGGTPAVFFSVRVRLTSVDDAGGKMSEGEKRGAGGLPAPRFSA